jgi:DnaK suppressor protein
MTPNRERDKTAEQFEPILRARYETLWHDIQRELQKYRGEQYRNVVQQRADPDDFAAADLLVDLNVAEINRDVAELRAVQHALDRVKRGTYGICAGCGEPINPQRLKALPHAVLCVECQARGERQQLETPSL